MSHQTPPVTLDHMFRKFQALKVKHRPQFLTKFLDSVDDDVTFRSNAITATLVDSHPLNPMLIQKRRKEKKRREKKKRVQVVKVICLFTSNHC